MRNNEIKSQSSSAAPSKSIPPGRSARRKLLIILVSVTAVMALFVQMWWQVTHPEAFISIAPPVMPGVNAYDTYLKAAKQIQRPAEVDNLVYSFRQAPKFRHSDSYYFSLYENNRPALETLHEGLKQEYRQPRVSLTSQYMQYDKLHHLVRLCGLQIYALQKKGDWKGAVEAKLDLIEFIESLRHGAPANALLSTLMFQNTALGSADESVQHLTASQAKETVRRLESILAKHVPFEEMIEEEKWCGLMTIDTIFSEGNWQQLSNNNGMSVGQNLKVTARSMNLDKKKVMRDYRDYLDACKAIAHQPYATHAQFPPPPLDPINQNITTTFQQSWNDSAAKESENAHVLLELALQAYKQEKGHYPAALKELVPGYLSRLPINPNAASGLFGYTLNGTSYILANAMVAPGKNTIFIPGIPQ